MAWEIKLYDGSATAAAGFFVVIMPRGAVKAAILLNRDTCAVERGAKLSYETLVEVALVVVELIF